MFRPRRGLIPGYEPRARRLQGLSSSARATALNAPGGRDTRRGRIVCGRHSANGLVGASAGGGRRHPASAGRVLIAAPAAVPNRRHWWLAKWISGYPDDALPPNWPPSPLKAAAAGRMMAVSFRPRRPGRQRREGVNIDHVRRS